MKRWYFQTFLTVLFASISIMGISETIRFGGGLGDIVYIFGALAAAFAYLFISLLTRNVNKSAFWIIQALFLLLLLYFIYSFTFGRGGEAKWNGTIFF